MSIPRSVLMFLFFLAQVLTGCDADHADDDAAPAGSSVKILSTSPDSSEALKRGDVVKLQAEVEYRLNADRGTLSLVIQESDTTTISAQTEVLTRGIGTSVLEAEFVVPDTKAVMIFTPLTGQGQTKTSTVDTLAFKVETDGSEELDLDEATLIDAHYCAISGVSVGSSYEEVVSVFGQPQERKNFGDESDEAAPAGRFLHYDGIYVGLKEDSVILINTERTDDEIHGALRPSSSRDDVVHLFGETIAMAEQGREMLTYRCRDLITADGQVMMLFLVVSGLVESISVVDVDKD